MFSVLRRPTNHLSPVLFHLGLERLGATTMPRRKRCYPAWLLAENKRHPGTIRFADDPDASACLEARRRYEKRFRETCALTQEELVPLIDAKTLRTVLGRMRKANLAKPQPQGHTTHGHDISRQ